MAAKGQLERLYTVSLTGSLNEILTLVEAMEYALDHSPDPSKRPMVQTVRKLQREKERIWAEYEHEGRIKLLWTQFQEARDAEWEALRKRREARKTKPDQ
jgi:hypothetical protein